MATQTNQFNTRIQLKSDTEANWNNSSLVPLAGEIIVYSADTNHRYARLKVGDGTTTVTNLPFIDASTLNGESTFVEKYASYSQFPEPGVSTKLYIDLSTNKIYHFTGSTSYVPLVNFDVETDTATRITYWGPGRAATAEVQDNVLVITNGIAPSLLKQDKTVITGIS